MESYLKQVEEARIVCQQVVVVVVLVVVFTEARIVCQQEKEAEDFAEAQKEFSGDVADTITRLKR